MSKLMSSLRESFLLSVIVPAVTRIRLRGGGVTGGNSDPADTRDICRTSAAARALLRSDGTDLCLIRAPLASSILHRIMIIIMQDVKILKCRNDWTS